MDPLSDFLPSVRVESAVYTQLDAHAPWGIEFDQYHHTKFGIVIEGNCYVSLNNKQTPIRLSRGSCYLLAHGSAFRLQQDIHCKTTNFEQLIPKIMGRSLTIPGIGEKTTIIGGRFIFAEQQNPTILALLPDLVHFKVCDNELALMQSTLQLLARETQQSALGSQRMIDRLAEIFLLQTLRGYMADETQRGIAWLGASNDLQITHALRLIHEHAAQPWTVATLAHKVGMSRSVFAQRFKTLLGESPMEYLTRCRIHKASRLLRESKMSIGEIANLSGYDSDVSFHKAFKRNQGVSPGRYRSLT